MPVTNCSGRSFGVTETSARLDGADLMTDQTVLTCSGGVATSEGTWRLKNAAVSGTGCLRVGAQRWTCCVQPGPNIVVRDLVHGPPGTLTGGK